MFSTPSSHVLDLFCGPVSPPPSRYTPDLITSLIEAFPRTLLQSLYPLYACDPGSYGVGDGEEGEAPKPMMGKVMEYLIGSPYLPGPEGWLSVIGEVLRIPSCQRAGRRLAD